MRSERHSMSEQELSIKEREQELYVESGAAPPPKPPVKPFPIYLRETPAVPLSNEIKAILWVIGILVLLLFVVAIWRTRRSSSPRRRQNPVKGQASARDHARPAPYPSLLPDGTIFARST